MELAGKNVLITGAARDIGAATARDPASRGARLALIGLEEPDLLAAGPLVNQRATQIHPRGPHSAG